MLDVKLYEAQRGFTLEVEKYLRLKIKPRPKWLPKFVHHWLLAKLMYLEEGQPDET